MLAAQTADAAVLWLNAGGATTACLVNLWAALTGWPDWRWLRFTIACFAGFYALSYATFARGWWTLEDWSPFMRGVSLPVWIVVWSWPALHSGFVIRRIKREIGAASGE